MITRRGAIHLVYYYAACQKGLSLVRSQKRITVIQHEGLWGPNNRCVTQRREQVQVRNALSFPFLFIFFTERRL